MLNIYGLTVCCMSTGLLPVYLILLEEACLLDLLCCYQIELVSNPEGQPVSLLITTLPTLY